MPVKQPVLDTNYKHLKITERGREKGEREGCEREGRGRGSRKKGEREMEGEGEGD